MPKLSRLLLVLGIASLVISLAIAGLAVRETLPPGRVLGFLVLAFWIVTYVVIRNLFKKEAGKSPNDNTSGTSSNFSSFAAVSGRLYLVTGGTGVLLGALVKKYSEEFFIAGAVTFCMGGYLLFRANSNKRSGSGPGSGRSLEN